MIFLRKLELKTPQPQDIYSVEMTHSQLLEYTSVSKLFMCVTFVNKKLSYTYTYILALNNKKRLNTDIINLLGKVF